MRTRGFLCIVVHKIIVFKFNIRYVIKAGFLDSFSPEGGEPVKIKGYS